MTRRTAHISQCAELSVDRWTNGYGHGKNIKKKEPKDKGTK